MVACSTENALVPGERFCGTVDPEKHRLILVASDEFTQVDAVSWSNSGDLAWGSIWCWSQASAGSTSVGHGNRLDLHGDGIARSCCRQMGREQGPKHRGNIRSGRLDARRFWGNNAGAYRLFHHMGSDTFTQLVDANYASLYRFALSLARNQADACDLTQQTFFIWAKKGQAIRDGSKAKSWLFTTLYREFLRGRRRDGRITALEDLPPDEADPPAPAVDVVAAMDAATVIAALQEVEEVFRAPLTLFYLEELSYQEIAEAIDVPIGTVMSRLSRAKTQLRAILAQREKAARDNLIPFATLRERRTP